jgi:Mn-dependent DtxR family transcriptional regulator
MQDKRSGSTPSAQLQRIERAILNLLLSEDHPWRVCDLEREIGHSPGFVTVSLARLHADGLLDFNGKTVRASRAAVRADELAL